MLLKVGRILLILASSSLSRRRLLEQAGIPHQVMVSGLEEKKIQHSEPKQLVQLLAFAKAEIVTEKIFAQKLAKPFSKGIKGVIGCDSIFEFEGEVFGKPVNAKEALERWRAMSGKEGVLHTGHAMLLPPPAGQGSTGKSYSGLVNAVVSTSIHFVELTQKEIEEYVETGEPLQCAGGFALEGRGGMFISRIDGCQSNVIGLSLPWLRKVMLRID